jgi:hypothetical protein
VTKKGKIAVGVVGTAAVLAGAYLLYTKNAAAAQAAAPPAAPPPPIPTSGGGGGGGGGASGTVTGGASGDSGSASTIATSLPPSGVTLVQPKGSLNSQLAPPRLVGEKLVA